MFPLRRSDCKSAQSRSGRASFPPKTDSERWYSEDGGREVSLDDRLKQLMQELGNAINDSLSDSDRIAEAIGEIRKAGFDVFLILEATIGFNKRTSEGDAAEDEQAEPRIEITDEITDEQPHRVSRGETGIRLKFTTQDQKFLRALKISVEEESPD